MLAALLIGFSAQCSDHTHDPSRPPSISRGVCHDASPTFDVSGGSVIFVKYHQVGGTTANKELIHGINWKLMKALNVTRPEGHFAVEPPNQGTGDTPIQRWVDCGIPEPAFTTTLLRHPVNKLLSAFFKTHFPSVPRDGGFDGYKGPSGGEMAFFGANRPAAMMWHHKRAQLARGSRRSTPGPARRRVDLESLLSYLKAYRAAPS